MQTDINLYEGYELYLKYQKKEKYGKYSKYSKNKKKYGFASAKEKSAAKDAYTKYKLYQKTPAKYPQYASLAELAKKYGKYKKYVSPYSKYSKYSNYQKYDKSSYDAGKNYGGENYRAGHDRYIAFMADLTNVTTNPGPEISVGLWSYSVSDLQNSPFKITANKSFNVTNCAATVIGTLAVGQNARVTYVDNSNGTLRVYNAEVTIPQTDVATKICFEATDGNNADIIFDVNRPLSDYDQYRGKIKIQHSNTADNNAEEGSARRIWVVNTLPLEQYAWGFGEIGGGVTEHSKAMLVAARTYARWYIEYATKWDEEGFDILSTSSSQIYSGYDYEIAHPLVAEAANSFLAAKISVNNELANICARVGADFDLVRRAIGADPRIGEPFMYAGPGFGGSCFPKDVKALIKIAKDHGYTAEMFLQTLKTNEKQKHVLADMVLEKFGQDLKGKIFSIWGLAFKAGTDDMRESSALTIINKLIENGALVQAHDPEAMKMAKLPEYFGNNPAIAYFENKYEALNGADGLLIITEWKEFRTPDFSEIKKRLKQSVIFDGRLLYDPKKMQELGFQYHSIGRGDQE